jgi:hypothetical protein
MTRRGAIIGGYRLALAGLALAAIVYELVSGLGEPHWSTTDDFSYFTQLSNLFAIAVFTAGGLAALGLLPIAQDSSRFASRRGAAVLYMLTTGIVYAVLLSGHHNSIPWVNTVLHRVMPIAVALDWLIDPPPAALEPRRAVLAWMVFPVIYIAYTLVRGPIVHWYPYFFVNPAHSGGYLFVAVSTVVIGLGQIAMGLAIAHVGRVRTARLYPAGSPSSA